VALTMRPIDHEPHKSTIFFMLGPQPAGRVAVGPSLATV
jgi:hypothetical protein